MISLKISDDNSQEDRRMATTEIRTLYRQLRSHQYPLLTMRGPCLWVKSNHCIRVSGRTVEVVEECEVPVSVSLRSVSIEAGAIEGRRSMRIADCPETMAFAASCFPDAQFDAPLDLDRRIADKGISTNISASLS
jgi:hypothetical protein